MLQQWIGYEDFDLHGDDTFDGTFDTPLDIVVLYKLKKMVQDFRGDKPTRLQ